MMYDGFAIAAFCFIIGFIVGIHIGRYL